jgi:hypothetical protein
VAARKSLENDGLSSIARKVYIMENTQPTKTKRESESKVDTSGASTKSGLVAVTEPDVSKISSPATTATMLSDSKKTWTNVELVELRSKAGLVAGALRDFQDAGGLVVVKNVEYEPGKFYPKIILVADGLNVKVEKTADGLDFEVLPLGSGIVAEEQDERH